jgi:hypothetical protein
MGGDRHEGGLRLKKAWKEPTAFGIRFHGERHLSCQNDRGNPLKWKERCRSIPRAAGLPHPRRTKGNTPAWRPGHGRMWAPAIATLMFGCRQGRQTFWGAKTPHGKAEERTARRREAAGPCVSYQSRGPLHTKGSGSSADTGHVAGIGLCEKGVATERIRPGMRKYPRLLEANAFLVRSSHTKRGSGLWDPPYI